MSSSGGSTGTATSTSTAVSEPWKPQQKYIKKGFESADTLFGMPREYFPNSTVTPFSPQTEMALGLTEGRALQGSPVNFGAQNLATDTLAGNYLQGNPYLDAMYDRGVGAMTRNFREATLPNIDSEFAGAGRYGSNLWANQKDTAMDTLGRNLEGYATNLYGGNYDQERARQMQAMSMAPTLANQDYVDFNQLMGVGQQVEGKANQYLGDQIARFNFGQSEPDERLARYMSSIGGNYGGITTGTQVQPMYGGNGFMDILGAGLSLGGMFMGGGPAMGMAGASMAGNQIPALWS